MSNDPQLPWIHIGECPVCVNGICRVRICLDDCVGPHLYAVCDECEAVFTKPEQTGERQFADAENPACLICGQPMYGEQARWAEAGDLVDSVWSEHCIFEVPSSSLGTTDDQGEASTGDPGMATPDSDVSDGPA